PSVVLSRSPERTCVGDRKPIFDKNDARSDQHPFELRNRAEKFLDIFLRAEAHDTFDASPVVPTAIEEDDFSTRWQVRHVSLEIPLCTLTLAWRGQRDYATDSRIKTLRDPLDDATLASCVASLENNDNLELLVDNPVLQLNQLTLQAKQFLEIKSPIDS